MAHPFTISLLNQWINTLGLITLFGACDFYAANTIKLTPKWHVTPTITFPKICRWQSDPINLAVVSGCDKHLFTRTNSKSNNCLVLRLCGICAMRVWWDLSKENNSCSSWSVILKHWLVSKGSAHTKKMRHYRFILWLTIKHLKRVQKVCISNKRVTKVECKDNRQVEVFSNNLNRSKSSSQSLQKLS